MSRTKEQAEAAAKAVIARLPKSGKWHFNVHPCHQNMLYPDYTFSVCNGDIWILPVKGKFYVIWRGVERFDFPDMNEYKSPAIALKKSVQAFRKKLKKLERLADRVEKILNK